MLVSQLRLRRENAVGNGAKHRPKPGGEAFAGRVQSDLSLSLPRRRLKNMATLLAILFFGVVTALPVAILFYYLLRDA